MKREFIYLPNFIKSWNIAGLSDADLILLENMILLKPDIGEMIQGAGGLRKARFAFKGSGKSGGIRVLYVDFDYFEKTYFLFAYQKSSRENITDKQKLMFKQMIGLLLDELTNYKRNK